MYNWSTDTRRLKKNPRLYAIWKLEQKINFGLGREKIDKSLLIQHWDSLHIDTYKKDFLALILYGTNPVNR